MSSYEKIKIMRLVFGVIVLFSTCLLFLGYFGDAFALTSEDTVSENMCFDLESVDLNYTMNNGKILEACAGGYRNPQVIMSVESYADTQISVEIPKIILYSVDQDCEFLGVFMSINDEDIDAYYFTTIEDTAFSRIITFDLSKGYNEIEFLGGYTLGDDVHQYCGEIYGHASKYLSPKKQADNGRPAYAIRCNESFEKIYKSTSDAAVCVKSKTVEKLIQRDWRMKL
jgi:hypothetical protein